MDYVKGEQNSALIISQQPGATFSIKLQWDDNMGQRKNAKGAAGNTTWQALSSSRDNNKQRCWDHLCYNKIQQLFNITGFQLVSIKECVELSQHGLSSEVMQQSS